MNKSIGHILRMQLQGLPAIIQNIAGLVQLAEYPETINDESTRIEKNVIRRIPISCDVAFDPACEASDLVPTAEKTGMIYFEEIAPVNILSRQMGMIQYRSRLRLVCWYSTRPLVRNLCYDFNPILINNIVVKLTALNAQNVGMFKKITLSIDNILPQNKAIFAAYTYDLMATGLLLSPYDFFAMDLTINYSMAEACNDIINYWSDGNYDPADFNDDYLVGLPSLKCQD